MNVSECRLLDDPKTPLPLEPGVLSLTRDTRMFVGMEDPRAFSFRGRAWVAAVQGVRVVYARDGDRTSPSRMRSSRVMLLALNAQGATDRAVMIRLQV